MEKNDFLLKDKIAEIDDSFFKDGFLTIYERSSENSDDVFCCLIDKHQKEKFQEDHNPPMISGAEGKPTIYGDFTYKSNDKNGLEPFLFYRAFQLLDEKSAYIDVSEEFVLYFKLFEKGESKQERKYSHIEKDGSLDDVIIIEPNRVRVKLKYLKEYITIRDMNLVVSFKFIRLLEEWPSIWDIKLFDNPHKTNNYTYRHSIRHCHGTTESLILGNIFIDCNPQKSYHLNNEQKNEKFIVGYDESGNEVFADCSITEKNYFELTYFRKEVLDKYLNNPAIYEINDSLIHSKFFTLKIDNNVEDYVPVYLVELSKIPYNEQHYWRSYNIPPQPGMSMSKTYHERMVNGSWVGHQETLDQFFKYKYEEFNTNWEKKFKWQFYKPLEKEDLHLFISLHIPTTNNVKVFGEQVLALVKLTIDRLNEKEIEKEIILEKGDKGITKLEKFMKVKNIKTHDMFVFLRNLQNLRSGFLAHSFSKSNSPCKQAIEYFGIKDDNYIEVAKDIFHKSIVTMNTLELKFNLKES